jgi:tRNA/rRNA methyltransferase
MCQRTASIPTAPDYETMNLAQSVAVFCYELGKGLASRAKEPDPAPGELVHALNTRARALLERINFFGDKSQDRMCAELQALAGRTHLSTREASMLLSFVTHVEKALASQSREP